MPAQPPFFTPTRMPAIGRSDRPMMSWMRRAAASDSRITWGLGLEMAITPSPLASASTTAARDCIVYLITSPHIQDHPRLVRHPARLPGWFPHNLDAHRTDARNARGRVLDHAGQFLRRGTIRRCQGHVDGDGAVIGNVDLVDQAQLVDIGRNFRVVDRLERGHDLV